MEAHTLRLEEDRGVDREGVVSGSRHGRHSSRHRVREESDDDNHRDEGCSPCLEGVRDPAPHSSLLVGDNHHVHGNEAESVSDNDRYDLECLLESIWMSDISDRDGRWITYIRFAADIIAFEFLIVQLVNSDFEVASCLKFNKTTNGSAK